MLIVELCIPLAGLAFAIAVGIAEEVFTIHTSDLLPRNNITQHLIL